MSSLDPATPLAIERTRSIGVAINSSLSEPVRCQQPRQSIRGEVEATPDSGSHPLLKWHRTGASSS